MAKDWEVFTHSHYPAMSAVKPTTLGAKLIIQTPVRACGLVMTSRDIIDDRCFACKSAIQRLFSHLQSRC